MIDTKELRRLAQAAMAAPDGLSVEWMDRLGQFQEAADASVVSELLDRLEAAESDAAHQKALADSALRVANGWERKCDALRAKIEQMEKRLRLILEEPENTMSNSKALREMVRQARLALEESK